MRHKRRWSVIYEGDVGSAGEWWTIHGTKESRYTPSAEVQSTAASRTNDILIVLIWRSSFESLTRRRSGASQKALECYIRRRRR